MAAVDFKSLLSKPADDVKKPKPLPAGTYSGIITSKEYGTSKQKGTPYVAFTVIPQAAEADVEAEDLEGIEMGKRSWKANFYLTPDAEFRIVELATSLSYPTQGRSLGELIEDIATNSQVIMDITQRTSPDGETIFNDINKLRGA